MRRSSLFAVVSFAFAFCLSCDLSDRHAEQAAGVDSDGMFWIDSEDRTMKNAIQEARETLPIFWDLLDKYPENAGAFSIKAALPTNDDSHEHIWVGALSRDGEVIHGSLENEPFDLEGDLKLGDPVEFSIESVSDWAIWSEKKQYGGFTMRVMTNFVDAETAAEIQSTLHENPIPDFAGE